ncbi:sugar transferase [Cereibacter sp. SYSU M97828]|nr:sugar transferase [Cereibacter flavus]
MTVHLDEPSVTSAQEVSLADSTEALLPGATRTFSYREIGKRAFDLGLCLLLLPLIAPIVAVLAAMVATDGGNPFFLQRRVGRGGRTFRCVKIRSMVMDAEARLQKLLREDPEAAAEWAEHQKLDNDPRITPLGRFLRKSSLDELPQLWNVIRGEMSIVGPRPVVPDELLRYGKHAASYKRVRPGVTGLWQATGRNALSYDERVQLDVRYEREVTLAMDLRLIFLTGFSVVNATGK